MRSKRITRVEFPAKLLSPSQSTLLKRVAAYARVSTVKDAQENSLQSQQEYFTEYIRHHPDWVFAGMYTDDGVSGLSIRRRDGFNRMVHDALDGKIDLILTKSLSRFARNTVDSLTTIRSLKAAGVAVYFQKENINTIPQPTETLSGSAITRKPGILRNYTYTGNLLLQTKFRENHLTKVTRKNQGELPRYHAADTHEAIISQETFDAVQAEILRRKRKYAPTKPQQPSPFTGLITCAICNKHYRRKTTATGPVWICSTYNSYGKAYCPSKAIPEEKLMQAAAQVGRMGKITAITAHNNNLLEFTLADGTNAVQRWQDRSRAESWTPEMRIAAGEKTRERRQRHAES